MEQEILLKENPNRFVIFPIEYHDIWEMYKKHVASFWTAEEIKLVDDIDDWNNKLDDNERFFIKNILAFFACSDGIVLENLLNRFATEIQIPEARCFYSFQAAMENIHGETYSLLIDTYIKDTKEKNRLLNGIENIKEITEKAIWAQKWINDTDSFDTRLIAFSVVEGIFFSGSFCAIFWLKKRGLMSGLSFSNELISRDEALHCSFAVLLHHKIKNKTKESVVHSIFREAVEIETNFINFSIPCKLIGMNAESMEQYIKFVADYWLVQLGYTKIYNVENPFEFMDFQSLLSVSKTNFFENRVSQYNLASVVGGNINFDNNDEDF